MNDSPSVTLELYVQLSGRWQIHANYEPDKYEECIENAKSLFVSRRFEATRVMRETFNPSDKRFHEEVLYRSPCRPKSKPKSKPKPGSAQARDTAARRKRT